jgi:RNA polymerase sigma factor (TIGR02999 family)
MPPSPVPPGPPDLPAPPDPPRPPDPAGPPPAGEITVLLNEWAAGDAEAGERLFKIIYPQLRRVVSNRFRFRRSGRAVQTTDLLHDTYLRLAEQKRVTWNDRAHFFAVAATLVRRVIVDHARRRARRRRGAGAVHLALDDVPVAVELPPVDVVDLDRALHELAAIDLTALRVVELRYFVGFSVEQAADILGLGRSTAVRAWNFARAWLGERLKRS